MNILVIAKIPLSVIAITPQYTNCFHRYLILQNINFSAVTFLTSGLPVVPVQKLAKI